MSGRSRLLSIERFPPRVLNTLITQSRNHFLTGFTFVELIFVTVVLSLLVVAVLPRFQSGWSSFRMERTAFQLAQQLRAARVLAVTQGAPMTWVWDAGSRQVRLRQPEDATGTMPARFRRPIPVPESVGLLVWRDEGPDEGAVERITFLPDGTSQSTTVLIGPDENPRYRVTVEGSTSHVVVR